MKHEGMVPAMSPQANTWPRITGRVKIWRELLFPNLTVTSYYIPGSLPCVEGVCETTMLHLTWSTGPILSFFIDRNVFNYFQIHVVILRKRGTQAAHIPHSWGWFSFFSFFFFFWGWFSTGLIQSILLLPATASMSNENKKRHKPLMGHQGFDETSNLFWGKHTPSSSVEVKISWFWKVTFLISTCLPNRHLANRGTWLRTGKRYPLFCLTNWFH